MQNAQNGVNKYWLLSLLIDPSGCIQGKALGQPIQKEGQENYNYNYSFIPLFQSTYLTPGKENISVNRDKNPCPHGTYSGDTTTKIKVYKVMRLRGKIKQKNELGSAGGYNYIKKGGKQESDI